MIEYLNRIIHEETFAERVQRMVPAAIHGSLIGTAYTLALSLVNVYSFPDLPIGIDWRSILWMWLGYALALALFGAVAAWFTEEYVGIVGGGVFITILLAIFFLITSGTSNVTLTIQSIITAVPLIGVAMLAAMGFRWTARRHLAIMHSKSSQHWKPMLRHLGIVLLIGLIPGIFNRMDLPAQQTLAKLDELLQAAPVNQSVWPQLPLKQVPTLKDHFGVEYLIYPKRSVMTAGSLDVTIRFADGFVMACILPVNSGLNFITDCVEGDEFVIQP